MSRSKKKIEKAKKFLFYFVLSQKCTTFAPAYGKGQT